MNYPIIETTKNYFNSLKETELNSLGVLRKSDDKVFAITVIDFFMQVYPGTMGYYLCYTAARCAMLASRYHMNPENTSNKKKILEEVQLYSSTKVVGLVMSQAALVFLGLTTIPSLFVALGWGALFGGVSNLARAEIKSMTSIATA